MNRVRRVRTRGGHARRGVRGGSAAGAGTAAAGAADAGATGAGAAAAGADAAATGAGSGGIAGRAGSTGVATAVLPPAPAGASATAEDAGQGRRRGFRCPHAIDNLRIVSINDCPVGVPQETPLTNRKRRRFNPNSAALPAIPSISTSTAFDASAPPSPGFNSAAMPAVSSTSTSTAFDASAPPSPGSNSAAMPAIPSTSTSTAYDASALPSPRLFLECREEQETSVPVPPLRPQGGLLDDDIEFLLNYGSEPDCDTDDDDEPFIPRTVVAYMDTPEDPVDVISSQPLGTSRHSTDVHDGAAAAALTTPLSTSSSGAIGPNFLDFEWRAFPETPINPTERREEFSDSNVGPTVPFVDPYDIFIAIWDIHIMEHIATETNRYAEELLQQLTANNALGPHSCIREWRNTTTDELYTYFAIVLAMGNVVKQRLESYWGTDFNILSTHGFRVHMSLRRFQLLSRCLHFNQNERLSTLSPESAEAKKFKIEPVVTHLNDKFQQLYNLHQNIAIDESLMQWKGWLEISQHIPNKAAAIGVKTYEVCESQTGYLWRFDIHAQKRSQRQASNESNDPFDAFTPTLVLKLLKGLENKGHTVWMDNFYNSPALARKLKTLGFDCVGTLRTNRQFVPEDLSRLTKENMRQGMITGLTSGDVDVMVWRDRSRVATISTYHGNAVAVKEGTTKPIMILDYNIMMGGVDKKDQMLASYPVERKRTMIWYKKLFRRLLNVSVLNSYIISKKNSSSLEHGAFREALIIAILDKHSTRRPFSKPIPDSLSVLHHHLAEHPLIDGRRTRRLCVLCKKRIHIYCAGCDKALCLTPCFIDFHRALAR